MRAERRMPRAASATRRRARDGLLDEYPESRSDPARRHGRVLRGRRAARPAGAARQAGDRRRRPAGRPRPRRRLDRVLRGAALRRRAARCRSPRPTACARRASTCRVDMEKYVGVSRAGDGGPAALHRPRRAGLDRRGVPRRDRQPARLRHAARRSRGGSRTRSARDASSRASVGRGRVEARGQDRLRHAQARRPGGGAAGNRGRVPGAAAGAAAVGRRAEDGGAAREAGRAHDRRARGARPEARWSAASARTATTCCCSRAASTTGRWSRSRPRPRAWARSTPTTRTPPTASGCGGRCSSWPTASPRRLRSHGLKARTDHAQVPRRDLPHPDARRDPRRRPPTRATTLFAVAWRSFEARARAAPGAPARDLRLRLRRTAAARPVRGRRRPPADRLRDRVAERFGDGALTRASLLGRRERRNASDRVDPTTRDRKS